MSTLLLSRKDIEQLISMKDVVEIVENTFRGMGEGTVVNPTKAALDLGESAPWPPYIGFMNAMPAYVGWLDSAGLKWVGGFRDNVTRGLAAGFGAFKNHLSYLPHSGSVLPALTAERNVELPLLYSTKIRWSDDERRKRVARSLERVGLAGRESDRVKNYSGGMKRRLNLAAGLLHDPDVLLLDEPTVGVDPQSRNAIFDNIEELKRRGKAVLYTTHYMEEAERLADRIVIIDGGRVVADDTKDGLMARVSATGGQVTLESVFLAMTGRSLRD